MGTHPTNPALLTYYLPLRSSVRTRRRAACTTAGSAMSSRSCSRYSFTASGCAAFDRSGKNSSVLAVPRSMCVRTLSKLIPTSRSISATATSDIKLALRIPCAQRSDEQPVLAPYRMTSVACIVAVAGVARLQLLAA